MILLFENNSNSQTLLRKEIFNYEDGDKWVIRTDREGPPIYKKYEVLNKSVYNSDSISYQMKVKYYDWKYSDFSYITFDSIMMYHYGSLNKEYFDSFTLKDTTIIVNVNNIDYKVYLFKDSTNLNECQLLSNIRRKDITPIISEHKLTTETAIKGIGVLKYLAYPGRSGNFTKEELLYYKKGNDSCGDIKSLPTSLNTVIQSKINFFPNPCSDYFKVMDEFSNVSIYNEKGQLLSTHIGTNEPISVKDLKNGIYFIQVNKNNFIYHSKLIVLH